MKKLLICFTAFLLILPCVSAASANTDKANEAVEAIEEIMAKYDSNKATQTVTTESQPTTNTQVQSPVSQMNVPQAVSVPQVVSSLDNMPAQESTYQQQDTEETHQEQTTAPVVTTLSMPKIFNDSIDLIKDIVKRNDTISRSTSFYYEGNIDKAASVIGRALAEENEYSLNYLGNFCIDVLPKAGGIEEQAKFLSGFMRGYSRSGVLMFTNNSVKEYTVSLKQNAPAQQQANANGKKRKSNKHIYIGKGVIFIPFKYGKDFTINVFAKKSGNGVKMWKILPDEVNTRYWSAGVWEKEITVKATANKVK